VTAGNIEAIEKTKAWRRVAIDTKPLRHLAYRRMFVGFGVSSFGFQLTAVAVPVEMFQLTRSSFWVGLLGIAGLVPLLVFALWGGAVADVVDRRRLLLASSLLMWSSTLGLLVQALLHVGSPELLLGLVAVQTTAFAVSSPTRQAIVPRLVPAAELPAANALSTTVGNAAMVAGPLVAGVLLARFDVASAYAVDAVAFTGVLWATIRLPALPPANGNARALRWVWGGGWGDVKDGLAYILSAPLLLLSFAIDIAAMVLAMPRALFPEVAADRYGDGGAVGWLFAAIALGSMLAGLTSGWIGRVRRQGVALVIAVMAWGLAVAGAGLARQLWLAVLLLAVGGAADLVSAVYRQTILQTYAPDELQGRMQGIFIAVVAGGPRLGDLRAGATAAAFGTTAAWSGGGVAAAVLAGVLAVAFPALLRYRPGQVGSVRSPHD
jgi:MFS family permease